MLPASAHAGAAELIAYLADRTRIQRLVSVCPRIVSHLKTTLSTRRPELVAVAVRLLHQLVCAHERVAPVVTRSLPGLLPVLRIYVDADFRVPVVSDKVVTAFAPAKDGEMEWSQARQVNLGVLTSSLLEQITTRGGEDATALVLAYIPTWSSATVRLKKGGVLGYSQRGFSAPGRGRPGATSVQRERGAAGGLAT